MVRNPDTLRRFGLGVVPLPVDADGADPSALARRGTVGAVVLTPAHQYPTGATLSARRRAQWIDWAREHEGLLIEDDYDGEFRYDRQPVGALAALDPEPRQFMGERRQKHWRRDFSLGWLVLPERWLEPVVALRPLVDRQTSAVDQLALAEMITSGAFDRHIRTLADAPPTPARTCCWPLLAEQAPAVTVRTGSPPASTRLSTSLPTAPARNEVIEHLPGDDIAVHGLASYRQDVVRDRLRRPGGGLRYAPEHAFALGAWALAAALADIYR